MKKKIKLNLKQLKKIFISDEYPHRDIILHTMRYQETEDNKIIRGIRIEEYWKDLIADGLAHYWLTPWQFPDKDNIKITISAKNIRPIRKKNLYQILYRLEKWGILEKRKERKMRGEFGKTEVIDPYEYIITDEVIKEMIKIMKECSQSYRKLK